MENKTGDRSVPVAQGAKIGNITAAIVRPPTASEIHSSAVPDRVSVALHLLNELSAQGVDTVFGIPGGAVSPIYGALLARTDIRLVNAKHETGAVFLAMGYAMATGRPGVVITTAGPGITNAITGMASAFYDGIPIILISGEVPTTSFGRGALQDSSPTGLDALGMMRRVTKMAAQVTRADSAVPLLRKAVTIAMSGRKGPVFLSLPLNIGAAQSLANPIGGSARTVFELDGRRCDDGFNLLLGAQRPLILAGAGARGERVRNQLIRLAEATGAPVAVTPKGKGVFPEDHEQYLGVFGFGGHESVIDYLTQGVDVLFVCASGLNDFSTNAWSPLLKAETAVVQCDIDLAQIGKNYAVDLGLHGPADRIIERMMEGAERGVRRRELLAGERFGVHCQIAERSSRGALTTAEVVLLLNEACPENAVFTADMGEHLSVMLHYLKIRAGGDFITCLGFGSMGSAIGTAIGYQMACPARRVYAVSGDGCFLMYGSELVTAVHHEVPVTLIIINDSRLNMCELGMRDLFGVSTDMSTPVVDYAAWARASGATGYLVRTSEDLAAALRAPVNGPVLIDVRIDPEIRLQGSQRNASLRQFDSH